jgi:hypothetical protein
MKINPLSSHRVPVVVVVHVLIIVVVVVNGRSVRCGRAKPERGR